MSTHNIHGTDVHFKDNCDELSRFFSHHDNKHEVQRHLEELEKHGKSEFSHGGHDYKWVMKEKDGKVIPTVESKHSY